jgi:hypothetical protein
MVVSLRGGSHLTGNQSDDQESVWSPYLAARTLPKSATSVGAAGFTANIPEKSSRPRNPTLPTTHPKHSFARLAIARILQVREMKGLPRM